MLNIFYLHFHLFYHIFHILKYNFVKNLYISANYKENKVLKDISTTTIINLEYNIDIISYYIKLHAEIKSIVDIIAVIVIIL